MFDQDARWIVSAGPAGIAGRFVWFHRAFDVAGRASEATLRITADARYELHVNATWLGHGPPRSWPSPWPVDAYDLRAVLRPGRNVAAVLVHHFGLGTFQYVPTSPPAEGPKLLAELTWTDEAGEHTLVTDGRWQCREDEGFLRPTGRIFNNNLGWEEVYDARRAPAGRPDVAGQWRPAAELARPGEDGHAKLEARDLPMLTREPVEPVTLRAVEAVQPAGQIVSLGLRPLWTHDPGTAELRHWRVLVASWVHSPAAQRIELGGIAMPAGQAFGVKLNGREVNLRHPQGEAYHTRRVRLRKGANVLLLHPPRFVGACELALTIRAKRPVRFAAQPDAPPQEAFAGVALGPFERPDVERFAEVWLSGDELAGGATAERFEEIWRRGAPSADDLSAPLARPLPAECVLAADVRATCRSERVVRRRVRVDAPAALQRDNADWTTVHPTEGADTRLLLDFGDEVVGWQEFEVDAPAAAVLDGHGFEFIQPDGRKNLAEGMRNTFRYVCREGVQRYRTFVRRGLRYLWLSVRHHGRPVRIRFVRTLLNTYPPTGHGHFACADARLERIAAIGARALRCCSEDTYTDCPTYEQSHWVGDAHNEAIVDLVTRGDGRLSRHCWFQAARSLERSDLVESHVPSSWRVIIPAFGFLWMRWAVRHWWFTGDRATARAMLPWIERNVRGLSKHTGAAGLLDMYAWNFVDWAPLDADHRVVAHQNCLAVLALRETAALAGALGQTGRQRRWSAQADALAAAINEHLWDGRRRAYADSIHDDGRRSEVFSQQTQTLALLAGVATGRRAERCERLMLRPPASFVTVGSPFFMFFLLEALAARGRTAELLKLIRDYWGLQIDAGATTTWEEYHGENPRKTRSHCHGWSAAPTYFLPAHVLGVQPSQPGYRQVRIAPRPGELAWARGVAPVLGSAGPRGEIRCRWENDRRAFHLAADLPAGTPARIELPFAGRVRAEAGGVRKVRGPAGQTHLTARGPQVRLTLRKR